MNFEIKLSAEVRELDDVWDHANALGPFTRMPSGGISELGSVFGAGLSILVMMPGMAVSGMASISHGSLDLPWSRSMDWPGWQTANSTTSFEVFFARAGSRMICSKRRRSNGRQAQTTAILVSVIVQMATGT